MQIESRSLIVDLLRAIAPYGFSGIVAALLLAALMGWIESPIMNRISNMEYSMWQTNVILRVICYSQLTGQNKDPSRCEPWKRRYDDDTE